MFTDPVVNINQQVSQTKDTNEQSTNRLERAEHGI
jgi:hypothetical protein